MKKLLLISLAFLLFVPLIKVDAEGEGSMMVISPNESGLIYELGDTVTIEWEQENMNWINIRVDGEQCSGSLVVDYNPITAESGTYDWIIPDDFYCLGKDVHFSLTGYNDSAGMIDYTSNTFQIISNEEKVAKINLSFENVLIDDVIEFGQIGMHLASIIVESYSTGYINLSDLVLESLDLTFTTDGAMFQRGNFKLFDNDTNQEICSFGSMRFVAKGTSPSIVIAKSLCTGSMTIVGGETKTLKLTGDIIDGHAGDTFKIGIYNDDNIIFAGTQPNDILIDRNYTDIITKVAAEDDGSEDELEDIDEPELYEGPKEIDESAEEPELYDDEEDIDDSPQIPVTYVDQNLTNRLRGKILLQVEDHGEAWYVRPDNGRRMYMKDGSAAYGMMRNLGLGISNADLQKIPVGIEKRFECLDSDGDGLCNKLEEGLGTDPNKKDSDGDGHDDGTEINGGYDPLGTSRLSYDNALINRLRGQILLQVESRGEAWYINPDDGKRYYMKDGPAAYQIMRFLSLGISNKDLSGIDTE